MDFLTIADKTKNITKMWVTYYQYEYTPLNIQQERRLEMKAY